MMSIRILGLMASVAVLGLAACGNRDEKAAGPAVEAPTVPLPATGSGAVVGGAEMIATDTLVTNAARAANLTTLVSAWQVAGIVDQLSRPGPFTVFAPDNAAFEKVPAATREALMIDSGKADLTRLLTYQVVPGRLRVADLAALANDSGGTADLVTLQGGVLKVTLNPDGSLALIDATGGRARITQGDATQANGVFHVIDTVVTPG